LILFLSFKICYATSSLFLPTNFLLAQTVY
jgi:hypothetical protein